MDIKEIAKRIRKTNNSYMLSMSPDIASEFAEAIIESYRAELLKEVGEPVGYLHQWIEYHPYGDTVAGEPCSAITNDGKPFDKSDTVTLLFTSDQVAAAIAKATKQMEDQLAAAQEEIERLRDAVRQQESQVRKEQATSLGLQDQLAKAEQRVAEACALQVDTETRFHWLDAARVAKEIRSGEWRKFVKEV